MCAGETELCVGSCKWVVGVGVVGVGHQRLTRSAPLERGTRWISQRRAAPRLLKRLSWAGDNCTRRGLRHKLLLHRGHAVVERIWAVDVL
jgi:hypothetical protein